MTPMFPSLSLAAAYIAACLILAATPGADVALFLSRTLTGGRAQGFAAQAGASARLIVHTFAAALGLSALLAASAQAYETVKVAGWPGGPFGTGRRSSSRLTRRRAEACAAPLRTGFSSTSPSRRSCFFVTFLPQFISASDPHASAKLFVLGLGFIAITTAVNAIIILVAGRFVAAAKRNPRALRPFDYGFAALMSASAARLV
jgi:threonine/homoserine/homoserine lactone efflux protein